MVSEMLNEVLEKEKKTAENEQNARLEAERILDEANLKAKAILADAQSKADALYKSTVESAQGEAAAAVEAAEKEALEYSSGLKASSEGKLNETIIAVKDIILK